MISLKPKKGHLLIAEPSTIGDLSFNRSVVLLADHTSDGSVGFILNKPLGYTIHDLIPEIQGNFKIYNGGPVEQDNLYFIHNVPDLIPESIEISNGIYWGGDFEKLVELIKNGKADPARIRFYIGYSGWSNGQLSDELKEKSWLTVKATRKLIFHQHYEEIWKDALKSLGGDYEQGYVEENF